MNMIESASTDSDSPLKDTLTGYIAFCILLAYLMAVLSLAIRVGNPAQTAHSLAVIDGATRQLEAIETNDWTHIGSITVSPTDVRPAIVYTCPVYERRTAYGRRLLRFWDDTTEEWIPIRSLPRNYAC